MKTFIAYFDSMHNACTFIKQYRYLGVRIHRGRRPNLFFLQAELPEEDYERAAREVWRATGHVEMV